MEFLKVSVVVAFALALAMSVASSHLKSLLDYQRELTGNFSYPNGKIINGHTASEKQFPYYVYIIEFNPSMTFAQCGGGIIHPNWVITSGFCVKDSKIAQAVVFLLEMGSIVAGSPRVEYTLPSSCAFLHPSFDSDTMENDIALLNLPTPLTYDAYIQPVALPSADTTKESLIGQPIMVPGFGATADDGTLPEVLQYLNAAQVPIVGDVICGEVLNGLGDLLPGSGICAGNPGPGTAAMCYGDSGSPATVVMDNGSTLAGIASLISGSECGVSPQVYTFVPHYITWIEQTIAEN